ncbi:MAG: general secretion pathway protein GspB [Desulfobulbaceae bacterium]
MSYILEALKKSERERKQGEIPDLQSDHGLRSVPGKRKKKYSFWKWFLVSVVLVLSALILYRGMQRDSVALQEKISALEKSVVQLKEQPAAAVIVVAPPPAAKEEAVSQPLLMAAADEKGMVLEDDGQPVFDEEKTAIRAEDVPRQIEQEIAPLKKPVVRELVSETAETLPLVQDLPSSVQQSLPQVKLVGHVYSKDPSKRMIIINNRICREGDLVEDQLRLEQILQDGVVLRYREIRFRMNQI